MTSDGRTALEDVSCPAWPSAQVLSELLSRRAYTLTRLALALDGCGGLLAGCGSERCGGLLEWCFDNRPARTHAVLAACARINARKTHIRYNPSFPSALYSGILCSSPS